MISLLLTTKGRPSILKRSLDSIIGNASSVDNYEIIFGIDDNDDSTLIFLNEYLLNKNINHKIITTEPVGYKNLYKLQNLLANESKGELLWPFVDDVEICSKNWDLELINNINEVYIFVKFTCGYNSWPFSILPIISKRWFTATGRFSNNSQTDLWLGHIADDLSIVKKLDSVICNLFLPSDASQHNTGSFYESCYFEFSADKRIISQLTGAKDLCKSEHRFSQAVSGAKHQK